MWKDITKQFFDGLTSYAGEEEILQVACATISAGLMSHLAHMQTLPTTELRKNTSSSRNHQQTRSQRNINKIDQSYHMQMIRRNTLKITHVLYHSKWFEPRSISSDRSVEGSSMEHHQLANTIHLILRMASAEVVRETSVTNSSSFRTYPHPDDHTIRTSRCTYYWHEYYSYPMHVLCSISSKG